MMRILKLGWLILLVFTMSIFSGCVGMGPNTQSGMLSGGAIGGLLGYGVTAIVAPQYAGAGAAIGVATGAAAGWALGVRQDQYSQQAPSGYTDKRWHQDSYGTNEWEINGYQREYGVQGPGQMPYRYPRQQMQTAAPSYPPPPPSYQGIIFTR